MLLSYGQSRSSNLPVNRDFASMSRHVMGLARFCQRLPVQVFLFSALMAASFRSSPGILNPKHAAQEVHVRSGFRV